MNNLLEKIEEYSSWRSDAATALQRYHAWLQNAQLDDPVSTQRVEWMLQRLAEDKLSIAFVAEFSRGKSELINAIFFAEYGQRVLPSAAGRTTMCPTELMYDAKMPPGIRLLPIETRAEPCSILEYKELTDAWTVLPLDVRSPEGMRETLCQVSLTRRVGVDEAQRYGLYDESNPDSSFALGEDGLVEIPQWRHAIINFPHPLLMQGLVIVDTPGLNAIGTEPELTLNLIPQTHAVLFILAADTGVTKTDIDVWRNHIGNRTGRMVVLNKIDSMWDGLRTSEDVNLQIAGQVENVARVLNVPPHMVFPVSAQKGLVGKVNHDAELLAKSRLPVLEQALSQQVIPSRRQIMCEQLGPAVEELTTAKRALLSKRMSDVFDQLAELKSLRGKNHSMVAHIMARVALEKKDFDLSLLRLQGTRRVFARLSGELFTHLGMDVLKKEIAQVHEAMSKSAFSAGINEAVKKFFAQLRHNLESSDRKTQEIASMMEAMYQKFAAEHGFTFIAPPAFSMERYIENVVLIEQVYQTQFGGITLWTKSRQVIMREFFATIEAGVRKAFQLANRDADSWLKDVMAPLEVQIREHKEQLKKRKHSLERVSAAAEELEEKISALKQRRNELEEEKQALLGLEAQLKTALGNPLTDLKAAA